MLLCPDKKGVFGFFWISYLSAYLFQILTYGLRKSTDGISIYFLCLQFFYQAFLFVFNTLTADFMIQIVCYDDDFEVQAHDVFAIVLGYSQNLFNLFEACIFILYNKKKRYRKYPVDMIMIIGSFILGGILGLACSSIIFSGYSDYNIYYYVAIGISLISSLRYIFQIIHTLRLGRLGTLSLVYILSTSEISAYFILRTKNHSEAPFSWDLLLWGCSMIRGIILGIMLLVAVWTFFKNQTIFKNNNLISTRQPQRLKNL